MQGRELFRLCGCCRGNWCRQLCHFGGAPRGERRGGAGRAAQAHATVCAGGSGQRVCGVVGELPRDAAYGGPLGRWFSHGCVAAQRHHLQCVRADTSENYLAALPLLLSGRARLLDDAVLQRELTGLERRVHANGRESVSHAAAASAHDDVAAAVCGALVAASASTRSYDMLAWFDDEPDLRREEQLGFNRFVASGGLR